MKQKHIGYFHVQGLGWANIYKLPRKGKPEHYAIFKGTRYPVKALRYDWDWQRISE